MTLDELGEFLGRIALATGRDIGPANVLDWEEVLPADLTLPEALEALKHHRQTSTDFVTPAHIIGRVNLVRAAAARDRLARAGEPDWPPGLTVGQESRWHRLWLDAVKAGHPDPNRAADDAYGITRPTLPAAPNAARVAAIAQLAARKALR